MRCPTTTTGPDQFLVVDDGRDDGAVSRGADVPPQGGQEIYERVRNAIVDGRLPPGSVMSQVVLAEQLGVSRTPLREALRHLQGEGLIEAEHNRQVRVAPVTAEDLEDLYLIRVTLESEALRLAVPLMEPEDLATLEGHVAQMSHYATEEDYVRWTIPHAAFHRELTRHAGRRVNTILDQLFDHAERYRRLHIGHGPSAWATASHREILDACKARDRERAARLLASHFGRTGLEVAHLLDPDYKPARLEAAVLDAGGEVAPRRGSAG
jgi:DNA-binding GntR family transcriptional regulator